MKKLLKILGTILLIIVILMAAVLIFVTVTEYRPADTEDVEIQSGEGADAKAQPGQTYELLSWNIGYSSLDETVDFFMDGGTGVNAESQEKVLGNLSAIEDFLLNENADFIFLQEVDENSTRSKHVEEKASIQQTLYNMNSLYAYNFKVLFSPYPIPPMGNINSCLLTLSSYACTSGTRMSLYCPFSWPVKTVNLKRCLLVTRLPVEGSDKELVLVNFHLEAYDDGEGKEKQTKMLSEFLNSEYEKGNYVIAGGDLNQTFTDTDISMYPVLSEDYWMPGLIENSAFGEHFSCLMDNTYPSCRSLDKPYKDHTGDFQYYLIDGFIVSDNITVSNMETINLDFVNSDHNPVRLSFSLD